ncbi:unnamed protein product [Acidithrix sp. C25]|nr:unnamed protein product [Acidithrix sp. C25]
MSTDSPCQLHAQELMGPICSIASKPIVALSSRNGPLGFTMGPLGWVG